MSKFLTLALIASLPTLAVTSQASAGQSIDPWPTELSAERSTPSIGGLGHGLPVNVGRVIVADGATVTAVPSYHAIVSVAQMELFIASPPTPCLPNATGFGAFDMCFDVVMPGGAVQEFRSENSLGGYHSIDGYTYTGQEMITVEYVETANYVSCMPSGPGSCRFHHYTLLED